MNARLVAPSMQMLRATITAALFLAAGHASADTFRESKPADPRGDVDIVNVAGTVEVRGWDKNEIEVEAELGRSVEKLDFRTEGQRTVVKVVLPRNSHGSGSSELIVKIPRDSSLSVNTVSADQRISHVRGAQRLQAVSGTIETDIANAEFEAKTVSGNIVVRGDNSKGSVRATSISGDIELVDIGPELDLNTVSGDMRVEMDRLDRARIKTTNGDLELIAALGDEARIDAESINGDLRFSFRGAVSAEFDIETFNGDIDNCFGPKAQRTRQYGPGNELRFTEGKGEARARIKTLNGGVAICKR